MIKKQLKFKNLTKETVSIKGKWLDKLLGAMAAALLLGLIAAPAFSQPVVPSGKTELQASQLILWYDNDNPNGPFGGAGANQDLFSFIQVTNASVDTPVWVHVQVFASSNPDDQNPLTAIICQETNFNDFYTPNDTHIYEMGDLDRNDPLNPTFVADFDGSKGFIVITPIDAPGTRNAIAHQHMFGNSYVFDFGAGTGRGLNAMGRDAVSFSTGSVVADGTELDGTSNGYVLIQPEILKFNFAGDITEDDGLPFFGFADDVDIVSIAFRDNYEGVFGYVAEPGDAVWTPLLFDEEENPISCSPIIQDCFFDVGINPDLDPRNDLLADDPVLCPNSDFGDNGWVKIAVSGLEGLENEMGLTNSVQFGFALATWMFAEGAATPVAPPPECTVDADCAEGEVCEAEECVPAPECAVDADCAEGEECVAGDCVEAPECIVDADCAAGQVCALGICIADPEGGGGGGCAIASTASAGSAAANALVVLIPLLGIGLRSRLRRREED